MVCSVDRRIKDDNDGRFRETAAGDDSTKKIFGDNRKNSLCNVHVLMLIVSMKKETQYFRLQRFRPNYGPRAGIYVRGATEQAPMQCQLCDRLATQLKFYTGIVGAARRCVILPRLPQKQSPQFVDRVKEDTFPVLQD